MAVRTSRTAWYVAATGALAVPIGVGFALDVKGFTENLLSEAIGVVVSVLVAVFVVERLLDHDRRDRWRLVSEQTTRTLRFALVKATLQIYLKMPPPRPHGADPRTADDGGVLAEGLRDLERGLRAFAEDETLADLNLEEILDLARPHLQLAVGEVMPRLLALGQDPELIERLMAIEEAMEVLDYRLWSVTQIGGGRLGRGRFTHREGAEQLADLVATCSAVVAHLDEVAAR